MRWQPSEPPRRHVQPGADVGSSDAGRPPGKPDAATCQAGPVRDQPLSASARRRAEQHLGIVDELPIPLDAQPTGLVKISSTIGEALTAIVASELTAWCSSQNLSVPANQG